VVSTKVGVKVGEAKNSRAIISYWTLPTLSPGSARSEYTCELYYLPWNLSVSHTATEVPYNITVKAHNLAGCGEEQQVYCFTQEGGSFELYYRDS
jgi:hypothetical protein